MMRRKLKIILLICFYTFSINAETSLDELRGIESDLSCTSEFDKTENNTKLEECIKDILENKINEKFENGVQLGVFSKKNKKRAEEKKNEYNKWKSKISSLKSSKAKCILKEFKGHKKLKGKYYVVVVFQNGVNIKKLQEKIRIKGFGKSILLQTSKITIDIDNKIVKDIPDDRIKILTAKADCFKRYKEKKSNKAEFIECLKKETINGIQVYAFYDKDLCNKEAKILKTKCIEKRVENANYFTIVRTIEASKIDVFKKENTDAFKLKKPEVLFR